MLTKRLEVRLDDDRNRKLSELAEQRGATTAAVVRALIDDAYEEIALARRLEAVRRIVSMNIEDMPEPDELSRQMSERWDVGDLYRR